MKIGTKPCIVVTWEQVVFSHSSKEHQTLGQPPKNGGVVPPWVWPGIPEWPPHNFMPLPGPEIPE